MCTFNSKDESALSESALSEGTLEESVYTYKTDIHCKHVLSIYSAWHKFKIALFFGAGAISNPVQSAESGGALATRIQTPGVLVAGAYPAVAWQLAISGEA